MPIYEFSIPIEIRMFHGEIALVDYVDRDLANHRWSCVSGYALHANVPMHRTILSRMLGRPLDKREICDHINHNPADNRRANLRLCTQQQNTWNAVIVCKGKRGVTPTHKGYQARIGHNGKQIDLGLLRRREEISR